MTDHHYHEHATHAISVLAVFLLADVVRRESRDAVRALHAKGIEVVMMTGDSRAVAESVAEELGIDTVLGGGAAGAEGEQDRRAQTGGRSRPE